MNTKRRTGVGKRIAHVPEVARWIAQAVSKADLLEALWDLAAESCDNEHETVVSHARTSSWAESTLDEFRVMLAHRDWPHELESWLRVQHGIEPLTRCGGEAHITRVGPCGLCAPRWGFVGERVKIR